jgi:ATP-dependent DNA ligase
VKNLAKLQAECAALGLKVETTGRASKEPYVSALRDHHWRKHHPGEPPPVQIMPMLLSSWENLDDAQAQAMEDDHHAWIVQPKMDGVRALLHIEDGQVRITSRTVSEVNYRLSEFQDNLPHLTTDYSRLVGTILDGELVCPLSCLDTGTRLTAASLQATMAVLATSPDNARRIQEEQAAHIRLHVFDILRYCGEDVTPLPLIERQEILAKALRLSDNAFIEEVPTFVVNKLAIHRRIIDVGGEGTVWKKANTPYEQRRRVGHWIKRKRGVDIEAFVSGFKPGNNGNATLVGAVEFAVRQANGCIKPVAWVSSWTDDERHDLTH